MLLRCNVNRTELTAMMKCCMTGGRGGGGEARASCNVNRIRKAYHLYYIPYVGAAFSHSAKRGTH